VQQGVGSVQVTLNGRKPNAQSKEGTKMRVHSIHEVNTRQQQHPFVPQSADSTSSVKAAAKTNFEDFFKSYCQQVNIPVASNSMEHRIASIYGGFFLPPAMRSEREPTLKTNAS
jgi:hypothetical protein